MTAEEMAIYYCFLFIRGFVKAFFASSIVE